MALDWSSVTPEHARTACDLLLKDPKNTGGKATGLFVVTNGQRLPAKRVLRLSYALANKLSIDSVPKFASGESTIKTLQRLGLTVERIGSHKRD